MDLVNNVRDDGKSFLAQDRGATKAVKLYRAATTTNRAAEKKKYVSSLPIAAGAFCLSRTSGSPQRRFQAAYFLIPSFVLICFYFLSIIRRICVDMMMQYAVQMLYIILSQAQFIATVRRTAVWQLERARKDGLKK